MRSSRSGLAAMPKFGLMHCSSVTIVVILRLTFSRRKGLASNCVIRVATTFPSFKTVDEGGEVLYRRSIMKTLRAGIGTSGRMFRSDKALRRLIAVVTNQ
jgi:hypothetical protein